MKKLRKKTHTIFPFPFLSNPSKKKLHKRKKKHHHHPQKKKTMTNNNKKNYWKQRAKQLGKKNLEAHTPTPSNKS